MRGVWVSRYDLRVARVDNALRGEWVITDSMYFRARGSIPFSVALAVDNVIEGTVHSFSIELSETEGEGHG